MAVGNSGDRGRTFAAELNIDGAGVWTDPNYQPFRVAWWRRRITCTRIALAMVVLPLALCICSVPKDEYHDTNSYRCHVRVTTED